MGAQMQGMWLPRRITRSRSPALVVSWLACGACGSSHAALHHAEQDGSGTPQVALAEQMELSRLVDIASERLGLAIQYERSALHAINITLRGVADLTAEQVWDLANQVLANHGFASICRDKAQSGTGVTEPTLSIVRLADAAALARIETTWPPETRAGFATVLLPVGHRSSKEISDAMKVLVSKPAGAVQDVPGGAALLISDLRPRLDEIVALVRAMDDPAQASTVERIEARNVQATQLVALVTPAMTAAAATMSRPLQGKLTATPDDSAMVLVAPVFELPRWRDAIDRFDRPADVTSVTYANVAFAPDKVARLIEQTGRDRGPRGSGDRWRIVEDPLGGLLIVTATPAEHEQIAALIDRLNALPAEARRPVRAFPIRNRGVVEIVEVLTMMLEAGVLEGAEITAAPESDASGPSRTSPDLLQRSPPTSGTPPAVTSGTTTAPSRSLGSPANEGTAPSGGMQGGDRRPTAGLTITADEGTNTLIAVGEPRRLAQLEELLRTIDVRQPQVMIEVLVVSLSEGDTLDLGVELEKIEVSGDTVITLASLFGLMPPGSTAPTGKGFSGLILNPGDFRILIRALQTLNEGRALNMPRVLVNNNQQANLDAVVQQPFVSTNASDTVATTSFGGFENAGTTITVKPQIARGDHLVLEYSVSLSAFVGESSDPGIPPPRQQNNLQSVVTVPDGYTVVVGGIEIETRADAVSQVPLLGDVPLIGEAFKSRSRSNSRSRFFVFIRPTVLRQEGFEDLKYLSDVATSAAQVDDGFPEVQPRIIK